MNWGLALSGGAACGLANIRVIEALEAVTLRPNCVGGSSMGAIVTGLYALGHTPWSYALEHMPCLGQMPWGICPGAHALGESFWDHFGIILG